MAGDAVTPAPKSRSDNGRAVRRRVSKFTDCDKENFSVFGDVGENQKKSPLPVGYPRKPLSDITAVLQGLNDQSGEGSSRPFTRSQNMGICPRNYKQVETIDRTGSQTGFRKKSSGKLGATTTGAAKITTSVRVTIGLEIADQENRDPNTSSHSDKKMKTVTFAEPESSSENAHQKILLRKVSNLSNADPSPEPLSTSSEVPETGEVLADVLKENTRNAVAMITREESEQEVKRELISTSSITLGKNINQQIPQADNDVKMEQSTGSFRRRNQPAREQKTLASRSSVAKFR